jgi:hypothetical protein
MSAPQPLEGTNPYTGMYQKRQFGVGNLAPTPNRVADYLANPPSTLVAAEAVNPLEEEADVAANPQPGIVPN